MRVDVDDLDDVGDGVARNGLRRIEEMPRELLPLPRERTTPAGQAPRRTSRHARASQVAEAAKVAAMPTFQAYAGGALAGSASGANEAALQAFVEKHCKKAD